MKNIFFTVLLMLCFCIPRSYGQLIYDDFSSYPLGNFDFWMDTTEWVGWEGNFSETHIIEESGVRYLEVKGTPSVQADIVGLLPTLNSGVNVISFYQRLIDGNVVGLIHDYSHSGTKTFAIVVEYDMGNATVRTSSGTEYFTIYPGFPGSVTESRFELNYEIDTGYFYHAGNLITSWKLGTSYNGDFVPVNQINAINIFTYSGTYGDARYLDMRVEQFAVSDEEVKVIEGLKVFPNPATDQLQISLSLEKSEMVQYQLTDVSGKVIKAWEAMHSSGVVNTCDVSNLPNGIYLLQVTAGEASKTEKIVISR